MATSARAPGRLWQPQEALHTEPVSTSCLSGLGQRTAFSLLPTRKEPWAALAAPGWPLSRGRQVWGGGTPPQPWADMPYVTFPSRSLGPRWGTGRLRAHWYRPQDPPFCAVKAVTARLEHRPRAPCQPCISGPAGVWGLARPGDGVQILPRRPLQRKRTPWSFWKVHWALRGCT